MTQLGKNQPWERVDELNWGGKETLPDTLQAYSVRMAKGSQMTK